MDVQNSPSTNGPHNGLSPDEVEEQFRRLFRQAIKQSNKTIEDIALEMDMGERNLQRILSGQRGLKTCNLVSLGNILGIDKSRACIAIEHFGDSSYYYDPTVIIAVDLIKPVVDNINRTTPCALEPLHPSATNQLSSWIAETVIRHQSQLLARREELEVTRAL